MTDATVAELHELVFRLRLWPVYRFVLIFTPVAILAYTAIRHSDRFDLGFLGIVAGIAIPVVLLIVTPIVWFLPVRVRPASIVGQDAFGSKREASWDEVVDVDYFSFGGMRYWRLHREDGRRPVLVPTFLRERDRFAEALVARAGPEHPLTLAVLG